MQLFISNSCSYAFSICRGQSLYQVVPTSHVAILPSYLLMGTGNGLYGLLVVRVTKVCY